MKRFLLAALLLLLPVVSYAADAITSVSGGDCTTTPTGSTCTATLTISIAPGYTYMGVYVNVDEGGWQFVACYQRNPSLYDSVQLPINWITRQHHHRFKLHDQGNCNNAGTPTGDDRKVTGTNPGSISGTPGILVQNPADDSPQWGRVYQQLPNGVVRWLGSMSGCNQYQMNNTCWTTDFNGGLRFTRRTAELLSSLAQLAATQKIYGNNPVITATCNADNSQCWIYDGFNGSPHYFAVAYTPGAYAGDPNAGHWSVVVLGSWAATPPSDYWAAVYGARLGIDAAASAVPGIVYGYYEN